MISASVFSTQVAGMVLSVAGQNGQSAALTIRDLASLTHTIEQRELPILYPQYQYQTGLNYGEPDSMGTEPFFDDITWTANYYYYHSEVGAQRYSEADSNVVALNSHLIAEALAFHLYSFGVKYATPSSISQPEIFEGPDGRQFYGCTISLAVVDWKNNE